MLYCNLTCILAGAPTPKRRTSVPNTPLRKSIPEIPNTRTTSEPNLLNRQTDSNVPIIPQRPSRDVYKEQEHDRPPLPAKPTKGVVTKDPIPIKLPTAEEFFGMAPPSE